MVNRQLTVGDVRKAIEGLSDEAPLSSDVVNGPDEWNANIVGVEGGIPLNWQKVEGITEADRGIWFHLEIVPMEGDDDDFEQSLPSDGTDTDPLPSFR